MLHRGQRILEFLHHRHAVVIFGAIRHAITGNEHLGFYLPETIQHRQGSHVGCANAPHTAHTDGGQEGHDGLGNIGQVRRHSVTWLQALCF